MGMNKNHVVAAVLSAVTVGLFAATESVKTYTTRVVGVDSKTVPGSIVYTYKSGNETWKTTNTVQRMAVSVTPNRYSKLKIIIAAKQAGKWQTVKDFISSNDLTDEWNACMYIEDGNPYFVSATNTVITSGIATESDVRRFLESAVDKDL